MPKPGFDKAVNDLTKKTKDLSDAASDYTKGMAAADKAKKDINQKEADEVARLEAKIKELRDKVAKLDKQRNAEIEALRRTSGRNDEQLAHIDKLRRDIEALLREIEKLLKEIEKVHKQASDARDKEDKKVRDVEKKYDKAQSEFNQALAKVLSLL